MQEDVSPTPAITPRSTHTSCTHSLANWEKKIDKRQLKWLLHTLSVEKRGISIISKMLMRNKKDIALQSKGTSVTPTERDKPDRNILCGAIMFTTNSVLSHNVFPSMMRVFPCLRSSQEWSTTGRPDVSGRWSPRWTAEEKIWSIAWWLDKFTQSNCCWGGYILNKVFAWTLRMASILLAEAPHWQ